MPESNYKFYSDILTTEQMQQALDSLPEVFRNLLGDCLVTAFYGFGTEIHADLQYVPMRVSTRWIDRFINDSLKQKIIIPGNCDFSFTTPDEKLEVLFCHEGDIHLNGNDDALIQKFMSAQPFSNFHLQSKAERAKVK
jgi:hypothetical protein